MKKITIKITMASEENNKPIIKPKTLELISKEIGDLDSGINLIGFLTGFGVKRELIEYPQTKWRMINDVFIKLATSDKPKDQKLLFSIIEEASHPLMHSGDEQKAKIFQEKIKNYLKYDGIEMFYGENGSVSLFPINAIGYTDSGITEDSEEYKEKISLLRKFYIAFMAVVETFCQNFNKLTQEEIIKLNKQYLILDESIWKIINELPPYGPREEFEKNKKYRKPFTNLFSAEKEMDGKIDWDVIRRELSARFGEIEMTYQQQNASDILAEPDKQKQLNDIMLYLSELKEKTKEVEKDKEDKGPPTTKIEITSMPELQIKGLQERVVFQKSKNKKISIHNFPPSLTWEEITMAFLNGQEVIIKTRDKTTQTTFEEMGFMDEKKKLPNKQWELLLELAKRNGEMSWQNNKDLSQKDIDAVKKRKQILSDTLKTYFQISDDPFSDYNKEKTYKIRMSLVAENNKPNNQSSDDEDDLELKKYLEEEAPQINDQP